MLSALIQRLESFEPLSSEAVGRLKKLPARLVSFSPREDVVREAAPRADVCVLIEGVAARYKALDGGRQAILGFLLPGDVDDSDGFAERLDHGIAAIGLCGIAHIPRPAFDRLLADFAEVKRAFRRMARLDEAIRRIWLANMGQRVADRQAAHLFCELRARLEMAGMGGPDWFANPLTQEHLANVLGISVVHMNRVMQHLREQGLLKLDGHVMRFPSPRNIQQYADFDGAYLRSEAHSTPLHSTPLHSTPLHSGA